MGRSRRKYNVKARSSEHTTPTDQQRPPEVEVELNVRQDKYDSSNALILPSKKIEKKEVGKASNIKVATKLSKKKRKQLEKILEKKNKKLNRAHLLEELQKSQASQKELSMLISTSAMQTKGLKRLGELTTAPQPDEKKGLSRISSTKGSRQAAPKKARIQRDDVLGFDSEESSDESEGSEMDNSEPAPNEEEPGEKQVSEVDQNGSNETAEDPEGSGVAKSTVQESAKETVGTAAAVQQEDKQPQPIKAARNSAPSVFMPVHRTEEIQNARHQLPILAEEQTIMEAIAENDVVVICGQTGSGKTTQVPQFLYEAGYTRGKMIGITEPRRVAAVSMSKRVAEEMSLPSSAVSYQIRFEGNVTSDTKIKFMTDGVLLKEIQNNFLLTGYSVIIIDEAHERSIYSDILIGLLSRIVPLRRRKGNPLKLIIMSATLRVEDFTENTHLFKTPPPVIKVDSRQHPVTIHFNKRTPDDYMQEAYRKVCKIHQQLPEGGILVFVTGQQEVQSLCRKLRKRFPENPGFHRQTQEALKQDASEGKGEEGQQASSTTEPKTKSVNLDNYSVVPLDEGQLEELVKDVKDDGDLSSSEDDDLMEELAPNRNVQPLTVLPLFSLLPSEKQAKVFQTPPEGTRLCVVATNVGETSLTIPNIKYVVDTGKVKMRVYDKVTGISAFLISWVSKASADQRAGRAGRTCPGHCYRLYSSAMFNDEFQKFTPPEITRRPVDDLVLQMKAMNIDKVVNFPYPSAPDKEALKAAEKKLILMGALEELPKPARFKDLEKWEWSARITPLGRAMSCFPVSPRYAKMLALSHQHGLLPYVVAVVAAMTVQEVFFTMGFSGEDTKQDKQARWKKVREMWAGQGHSLALGDVMVLLKAVGASEFVGCTPAFCESHGLRFKAMVEIRKLRIQLTNELNLLIPNLNLSVDPALEPPTDLQAKLIRQVLLMGFSDHIAKKMTDEERCSQTENAIAKNAYKSMEVDGPVFIHPNSVLSGKQPPFVLYQEIFETSRMFMRVVAEVEPEWLPVYAPKYCTFSPPLEEPPPHYDHKSDKVLCSVTATFGPHAWQMEAVEQEFPASLDKFRWFARFLLQGDVLPFFEKYSKLLLSPPITMIKSWARLQPRTEHLLQALVGRSADSRQKLCDLWDSEPKYLLREYLEWIQESLHNEVTLAWPPKPK
ncbi:hypothetical protein V5799_022184 [Amblyomma americanum]|uniref:Uncharacterized protein n=2 Tax=Amblyomma americanum TaxID=6943 RepID=A0AAQ4FMQ3_AMBAM